jgi:hypothetical protein
MDTRDILSVNRKQDDLSDFVTLFDTLFEVRPTFSKGSEDDETGQVVIDAYIVCVEGTSAESTGKLITTQTDA